MRLRRGARLVPPCEHPVPVEARENIRRAQYAGFPPRRVPPRHASGAQEHPQAGNASAEPWPHGSILESAPVANRGDRAPQCARRWRSSSGRESSTVVMVLRFAPSRYGGLARLVQDGTDYHNQNHHRDRNRRDHRHDGRYHVEPIVLRPMPPRRPLVE